MTFRPVADRGRWFGPLAILALVALDVVLIRALLARPVDGVGFILALLILASVLVILYLVYRTLCAFTLEYWVDRDGVTLVWGPTRHLVPMGQIERIVVAPAAAPQRGPAPWHWPCPNRRRMITAAFGPVNSYSTLPLQEQVILVTPGESYGLSPIDSQGFLHALQERYQLGANRRLDPELKRPPLWTWPLWSDRAALFLMAAGLLTLVVMFGVLCFRYPDLSSDLPVHFDPTGLPDRIEDKSALFALPFIGLAVWVFNTGVGVWLYRHVQRGAAYLLWFGALAVQGIAGLALFNLMRW